MDKIASYISYLIPGCKDVVAAEAANQAILPKRQSLKKTDPDSYFAKLDADSDYYKKQRRRGKEIENNPNFQKELRGLRKKGFFPKTSAGYQKRKEQVMKEREKWFKRPVHKVGDTFIYFKEERDFCDRYGVGFTQLFSFNKVQVKESVEIITTFNKDGTVNEVKIVPKKEATETDIKNRASYLIYLRDLEFGKPTETRGRKPDQATQKRDLLLIKYYESLIRRGEKHPIGKTAKEFNTSPQLVRQRLKKYKIKY